MKKTTLDRILQSQGFGTRKGCRRLIREGAVAIAGATVSEFRDEIDPHGLVFSVKGEEWIVSEKIHLALNKPPGYECSRNPSHHPGVLSLLPEQFMLRDVQPVGRLDHDTTGLLLLSDDGAFIHAQSSPRRRVPKVYIATTQDPVTPELVARLISGVTLDDEPAPLSAQARQIDAHTIEVVLEQGKYHQVKRMLAAAGNHCAALRRTAIGGLTLDALGIDVGQWCYLGEEQLRLLVNRGQTTIS